MIISCMVLHESMMCALSTIFMYDYMTKDQDINATDQTRLRPGALKKTTWFEKVKNAQRTIQSMFLVNKGFTVDSGAAAHVMP